MNCANSKLFFRLAVLLTISSASSMLLAKRSLAEEQGKGAAVHLFILSGQSNMAGMDPKAGFVPEAKALFGDGQVAYIKVVRGGQPIRYWVKEWNEIAAKHGIDVKAKRARDKAQGTQYYEPIVTQCKKLLAAHPNPESLTFCWMQGERDAKEQLSAAYAEALQQLIANLRRDLNAPKMKFVIGRLSDFGKPGDKHWEAVRKAQVDVANADPLGAWVDCDDLNDKEKNGVKRNDLHYTKAGYELLGRRYARQARALVNGSPGAANGRPQ